jgi:uncharacterized protein
MFQLFKYPLTNLGKYKKYIIICIILTSLLLLSLTIVTFKGIHKYLLMTELNLNERYGNNTYCIITGAASGQGKDLAIKFAKRGFNLLLIGSKNIENTKKEIINLYPVKVELIIKDFRKAHESDFFDEIERKISELNTSISILINNIGYRTGWNPYHEMDPKLIIQTISAKAIVQSYLIRLCIPIFLKRKELGIKSGLINISAQCLNPNFLFGFANEISVPYMSVYEATNAYAFYHSQSIYKEYQNQFDILNITPGAVITKNTPFLKKTIFHVDSDTFTDNIIKMLGQIQGATCAYIGHAMSGYLINLFPFAKNYILEKVGLTISSEFMKNKKNIELKYD